MSSVLQPWLEELSYKKQTVALGSLRSPDTLTTLQIKTITVWMRTKLLRNADPMTGFMHAALDKLPLFEQIDREFERLPLHTAHHIMLSMQVIGIEYWEGEPEQCVYVPGPRGVQAIGLRSADTRAEAWKFYTDIVRAQHLNPETRAQYEARYTDNISRVEEGLS